MKKAIDRLLLIAAGILIIGVSIPVGAVAEESEYNILVPIVLAVNKSGDCLMSDGYMIWRGQLISYLGEDYEAQPGDVLKVTSEDGTFEGMMTDPAQYILGEKNDILYLGKAEEIYADYVKELTVTELKTWGYPVWSDDEGNTYDTKTCTAWDLEQCGGISPYSFSIGDTALCVTECYESYYYGDVVRQAVILEKTSKTAYTTGDINGDSEIDASDAALLLTEAARLGAGQNGEFTQAQLNAADVNKDGVVDASDSAVILAYAAAMGASRTDVTLEDFI